MLLLVDLRRTLLVDRPALRVAGHREDNRTNGSNRTGTVALVDRGPRLTSLVCRARSDRFVQNLRRRHDELGADARHDRLRVAAAFNELASAV